MKPETFERALHLWPKWLESIEKGRGLLRCGPSYPPLEEMRDVAARTLAELGFPKCTLFELYWLCCVFSDYEHYSHYHDSP
jgi:hypothetical protein